ncbi:nucleolar protein 11-like [Scleropages formosus]|uniref:Nucleolar protein 11 n=1 Tax=Scleropages formosus TaxID=113540 RepID=A0A8C9UZ87_SCLFO|nr:nucleolar protein 11 [Scleropages formosus]
MAALFEGFTLCGVVSGSARAEAALLGVEAEREEDRVVVTDCGRSVTVYKVSDQKPLGSWHVRQGQSLTCPAVWSSRSGEYVAVTDSRVIRIWKDDDTTFEKTFKATVCADVARIHAAADSEPVVLFARGAVRMLDALLEAPQQPIEEVLSEEEVIRWSCSLVEGKQLVTIFTTEQKEDCYLYLQRFNPNSLHKYKLETGESRARPLSLCATVRNQSIKLLCLYSSGCLYQSVLSMRGTIQDGVQLLPRTLLLRLPVEDGHLSSASVVSLDEGNLAMVGVPHPSASAGKEFLCIWNTNFQTLQAAKELTGRIYGQLWSYSGRLYVPHGKALTVIPYECERSSLATALGRLQQDRSDGSKPVTTVVSWNTLLHEDTIQHQKGARGVETRQSKSRKSQMTSLLTVDQVLEKIKSASEDSVTRDVEMILSGTADPELQLVVGRLASQLVSRCQSDSAFYPHHTLAQLVHTRCVCHSLCPNLLMLALEKKDYSLAQLCLQHFPDIPEAVTCACLKAFLDAEESDLQTENLEPDSVSFMEGMVAVCKRDGALENGFSPVLLEEDSCDVNAPTTRAKGKADWLVLDMPCPVGVKKAALLNEILQTAHTDSFLLPHLKDLTAQQVVLFLQYLQFLYLKYYQDISAQAPGLRSPTVTQIMDWVCSTLDAHFTVLVMLPEARDLLFQLHKFVRSQVRLICELGKIQGSLQDLHKLKQTEDADLYSIEVIELF